MLHRPIILASPAVSGFALSPAFAWPTMVFLQPHQARESGDPGPGRKFQKRKVSAEGGEKNPLS